MNLLKGQLLKLIEEELKKVCERDIQEADEPIDYEKWAAELWKKWKTEEPEPMDIPGTTPQQPEMPFKSADLPRQPESPKEKRRDGKRRK
jgi:hypothetical protein